jgi:hypothetical protein
VKISRRNTFKILTAASTAGASLLTEACNRDQSTEENAKRGTASKGAMMALAMPANVLNVVVHGLAGVLVAGNNLQLLIPDVPDHAYGIGGFCMEQPMPAPMQNSDGSITRYTYTLQGDFATGSYATPSPATDAVLASSSFTPNQASLSLRNVIMLPASVSKIISLRPADTSSDARYQPFQDNHALKALPTTLPLLHVFQYVVNSGSPNLSQGGNSVWTWASGSMQNLHLWCGLGFEIPGFPIPGHLAMATAAFNSMFTASPGLAANPNYSIHPAPAVNATDISTDEQLTVSEYRTYKSSGKLPGGKSDDTSNCWTIYVS